MISYMTLTRAMHILGLDNTCSKDDAFKSWKLMTVENRRSGNDEQCKILSEVKQKLKQHFGSRCIDCGVRVKRRDSRCMLHSYVHRFYGKSLKI